MHVTALQSQNGHGKLVDTSSSCGVCDAGLTEAAQHPSTAQSQHTDADYFARLQHNAT